MSFHVINNCESALHISIFCLSFLQEYPCWTHVQLQLQFSEECYEPIQRVSMSAASEVCIALKATQRIVRTFLY